MTGLVTWASVRKGSVDAERALPPLREKPREIRPLYLADLGLPPELWAWPTLGLDVGPVFAAGRILEIS